MRLLLGVVTPALNGPPENTAPDSLREPTQFHPEPRIVGGLALRLHLSHSVRLLPANATVEQGAGRLTFSGCPSVSPRRPVGLPAWDSFCLRLDGLGGTRPTKLTTELTTGPLSRLRRSRFGSNTDGPSQARTGDL